MTERWKPTSEQLQALVAVYDISDEIRCQYATIRLSGRRPPPEVSALEANQTDDGQALSALFNDLRDAVALAEELEVPQDRIVEVWVDRLPDAYSTQLIGAAA